MNFQADQAAATICGQLMAARSLAMSCGSKSTVSFSQTATTLSMTVAADSNGDGIVSVNETRTYPIQISLISMTVPTGSFSFSRRGVFSASGWQAIATAAGGYSKGVYVFANGMIYVQ
jgi:hypothetical protein